MPGRETVAAKKARALRIVTGLARLHPDAECALTHRSALELLVATILSAQCTDERVNLVTPALFREFPNARAYAQANPARIEELIHSAGFFRAKTRSIQGMARALVERHAGAVPDTMEDLVRLPGVGRKTANVVLGTWFGRPALFVDTHVTRVSGRLELTRSADPVVIEQDLAKLFPSEAWTFTAHAMIWHGRRICKARTPLCGACGLRPDCPFPARRVRPAAPAASPRAASR